MYQGRAQALKRSADNVACGLGFFSIGLGLAELLAPRLVARAAGLRGHETLVRLYGIREIAAGVGLLLALDRKPWLWGRVAGDVLDLATLARGKDNSLAIAAVAGVTAADIATATTLARVERQSTRPVFDYSDRSGFPRPASEMRGAARTPLKQGQTPFQERATVSS